MSQIDILVGDAAEKLKTLPACHFHCAVTSPPYFGLRNYGVDGQIGREDGTGEYLLALVSVFEEVHRVLRDDGSLWVNIGDAYDPGGQLRMLPAVLALAMRGAGWRLRQEVIWHKPNPMPESVKTRCTRAHEYVFHFTKNKSYFWDEMAMQEPGVYPAGTKAAKGSAKRQAMEGVNARPPEYKTYNGMRNRRSVWTVTTKPFADAHFATFPPDLIEPAILASTSRKGCCVACGAHWARLVGRPEAAPEVEGSQLDRFGDGSHGVHRKVGGQYQKWLDENPKQTLGWEPTCDCMHAMPFDFDPVPCRVLDPFGGAGTTALVAAQHGLDTTLIELNPEYVEIAKRRLGMTNGLDAELEWAAADFTELRRAIRYMRQQAEYDLPVPY